MGVLDHLTKWKSNRSPSDEDQQQLDELWRSSEQMERRLDATEGDVEAFDLGKGKTLSEEIAELEVEGAIEEELAALKARVASNSAEKDG